MNLICEFSGNAGVLTYKHVYVSGVSIISVVVDIFLCVWGINLYFKEGCFFWNVYDFNLKETSIEAVLQANIFHSSKVVHVRQGSGYAFSYFNCYLVALRQMTQCWSLCFDAIFNMRVTRLGHYAGSSAQWILNQQSSDSIVTS